MLRSQEFWGQDEVVPLNAKALGVRQSRLN
jgi:hypothetical protein